MIHPKLFPFFRKLDKNNSKAWFNPHKAAYKDMRAPFEEGLDELAVAVAEFDDSVERYLDNPQAVKVFRIYKDTRFSKSEIPLKTNISGYISAGPNRPMYYVQAGPGQTFAGGGIYLPEAPLLRAIREELTENYEDLDAVLTDKKFQRLFPEGLSREHVVKTAPRGYSADDPAIDYLRLKSFTTVRRFTDEEAVADSFPGELINTFHMLHRLNRYLERAISRLE